MKKICTLALGLCWASLVLAQLGDLDYFRALHPEPEVRTYVERAYTDVDVTPLSLTEFDALRAAEPGESFIDPQFGRKWTLVYDRGFTIMNSERNAWNADTSLFFLEAGSGSSYRKLALFDGHSLEYLKTITVNGMSKTGSGLPSLRWMPGDPDRLFWIHSNKIHSYSISQNSSEVYEEFASFTSTEYRIAGGDGNEVSPNGDFLIGNKGKDCFVYNFFEKKVVRIMDNQRFYFDPSSPFPTMNLGNIDYATAFAGYIFELNEDGGGTQIRDYNGSIKQSLYRRTPHMDPTFFNHEGTLYPGIWIRYNAADAAFYAGKGLASEERRCYFHAFDPENPAFLIRMEMDLWPSANLGSGGQLSANRYGGTTGILNQHGPALYDLPWEARFGEVSEKALYDKDAGLSRRIAQHYIAFEAKYPSSSYQPEGWISPDGSFVIIKTYWGWYRVDISTGRLSQEEVDSYLNGPLVDTYELNVENGRGGGAIVAGVEKMIWADEPHAGYVFDQWTGDVEYLEDAFSSEARLIMPAKEISLVATYREADRYSLEIQIKGSGSVMTNPSENSYRGGTPVALIPAGSAGASFVRWEGDLNGNQNPAIVVMDSTIMVVAIFSDWSTDLNESQIDQESFYLAGTFGSSSLEFRISLPHPSKITLEIFDIKGSSLGPEIRGNYPAGVSSLVLSLDEEPVAGFYFARLQKNGHTQVLKFILQ